VYLHVCRGWLKEGDFALDGGVGGFEKVALAGAVGDGRVAAVVW